MTNALLAPVSARLRDLPAWVVVTEVFIGLGWLRAATEKLIDPPWWAGGTISDFLADHDAITLGASGSPFVVVRTRATTALWASRNAAWRPDDQGSRRFGRRR